MTTSTPETVERPANPPSARLIGSAFSATTKTGLRVTMRPFSDGHPNNQHIEAVVHLDWPSYAETHFLSRSYAIEMIQKHIYENHLYQLPKAVSEYKSIPAMVPLPPILEQSTHCDRDSSTCGQAGLP